MRFLVPVSTPSQIQVAQRTADAFQVLHRAEAEISLRQTIKPHMQSTSLEESSILSALAGHSARTIRTNKGTTPIAPIAIVAAQIYLPLYCRPRAPSKVPLCPM